MVAPARLQTLGLGMAQQQQAAHGFSGFLPRLLPIWSELPLAL